MPSACSYNGAATLRDCLEGLAEQTYRDYEVIVVNDGSTDDTSRIAGEYDVRLIESENRGFEPRPQHRVGGRLR